LVAQVPGGAETDRRGTHQVGSEDGHSPLGIILGQPLVSQDTEGEKDDVDVAVVREGTVREGGVAHRIVGVEGQYLYPIGARCSQVVGGMLERIETPARQ
jgi:hypothetical protein